MFVLNSHKWKGAESRMSSSALENTAPTEKKPGGIFRLYTFICPLDTGIYVGDSFLHTYIYMKN